MTYNPTPHLTQNWVLAKPAARGRGGMVVSQVKAAAEAGAAILAEGGSAADAAVAAAFALAAIEPWNCGLGGIGFAQVAGGASPGETFDFGPISPAALDPSAYPMTGRMKLDLFPWPEVAGDRNVHGPMSALIPSAVAGYALLHERYGRLPWRDVLAPAVALSRRGLPQDWYTTLKVAASAAVLRLYPESARIYLPDGLPPVAPYQGTPGFCTLGRLPETLERLQSAGWQDFYRGDIAASVAADMHELGGFVSAADLAACTARVLPALRAPWRGRTLLLANGLTAAPTYREVMRRMADADYSGAAPSAAWYADLSTSMKAAYAERLAGLGAGDNSSADSCTTHLSVCDKDGMMVSMTTTLLSSMGSRMVLPRTGVLMNNGVMWFDPRPNTPNAIGPGKRPLTNMSPIIALDADGRAELACGASGGRRIMAAVFQLLSFVADFGMDPELAAHHPRIDVCGPDQVSADRALPAEVLAALRALGSLDEVDHGVIPINFACPNLIRRGADGAVVGVSDLASPWSGAVAA